MKRDVATAAAVLHKQCSELTRTNAETSYAPSLVVNSYLLLKKHGIDGKSEIKSKR